MTTSDITPSDISRALAAVAGGDYVSAFDRVLADVAEQALGRAPRSTVATRKAAFQAALEKSERPMLRGIYERMRSFMAVARKNTTITSAAPHELDAAEAKDLMVELLDTKVVKEFIDARYDQIRNTVFASITETFAAQKREHPEHLAGSLEVPELGKRFSKEAVGRTDPSVDEERLRELLGEQLWSEVTVEEVVPATTVRRLDHEALMKLAARQPVVMEHLRESVTPGQWKTPRLFVRDIAAKKKGA